ncbi:MAG: HAD family hydrolase [Chlamydiales bacterium]
MSKFKGIIALDIDGTLTTQADRLEQRVSQFLNELIEDRWRLIFLTGRTFSFANPLLASLQGNYFIAVQNGAAFIEMPQKRIVKKHYLSADVIEKIDAIFAAQGGGLLVESGQENGDICFYKPSDYTKEELNYIDFRKAISPEKWVEVNSFNEIDLESFAVGKYFSNEERAYTIAKHISQIPHSTFNITVIRDHFHPGFFITHVNEEGASKGRILDCFIAMQEEKMLVIGAGDDYNDAEMLEKSAVKIVMEDAPKPLCEIADIIAPTAEKQGIIAALKEAIERYGRNR